jgi:hypothetical protein
MDYRQNNELKKLGSSKLSSSGTEATKEYGNDQNRQLHNGGSLTSGAHPPCQTTEENKSDSILHLFFSKECISNKADK